MGTAARRLGLSCIVPRCPKSPKRHTVEPVAHEMHVVRHIPVRVDYRLVLPHRSHRSGPAVQWRPEHLVLRVPVGRVGVLADVHRGELRGAFPGSEGFVGSATPKVVQHLVALAHVEPVGVERDVEVPIFVPKLRHVHRVIGVLVRQLPLLAVEPRDGVPTHAWRCRGTGAVRRARRRCPSSTGSRKRRPRRRSGTPARPASRTSPLQYPRPLRLCRTAVAAGAPQSGGGAIFVAVMVGNSCVVVSILTP